MARPHLAALASNAVTTSASAAGASAPSAISFTDVRDMVRAYVLALEKCEPGEVYNICRGQCWTIREMLDMLLAMSTVKIEVKQDPARLRPSDVQILLGDNSKFVAATGWQPVIPFEQTLRDMLEYWRAR